MSVQFYIKKTTWVPSEEKRLTAYIVLPPSPLKNPKRLDHLGRNNRMFSFENKNYYSGEMTNATAVGFVYNCTRLQKIPKNLTEFFPNLFALNLTKCGLTELSRKDFKSLIRLREISLIEMKLQKLPSDLFKDLTQLEVIRLDANQLGNVGRGIFRHLKKILFISLAKNSTLDLLYTSGIYDEKICKFVDHRTEIFHNFEEFNDLLDENYKEKFFEGLWNRILGRKEGYTTLLSGSRRRVNFSENFNENFPQSSRRRENFRNQEIPEHQRGILGPQSNQFSSSRSSHVKFQNFGESSTSNQSKTEKFSYLKEDLEKIYLYHEFKDFTIHIKGESVRVFKFMFIARSEAFIEMIRANWNTREIFLTTIEPEVFKVVLDFVYHDKFPEKFDKISVKVFVAASQLKLYPLWSKVGELLYDHVSQANCLDILINSSERTSHKKLKEKAFGELKKLFPHKSFNENLMSDKVKLRELKRIQENFDSIIP